MTPQERAAWGKRSRAASGVPAKIEDPAVLGRLVVLSEVEHDDGGSTAVAATRRRLRKQPTAAIKQAQGADGA